MSLKETIKNQFELSGESTWKYLKEIQPQTSFSPFLPNSAQIREMRLTMGQEKAAEYLTKIMDATLARYHFEKLITPSQRLREIMARQGILLEKLSELSGISMNSLSGYRMGHAIPKRSIQEKIAMALGVIPEEIWGGGMQLPLAGSRGA